VTDAPFTVLCFMGRSGSGKSTCGKFLMQEYGFVQAALADPLKRFCADVFQEYNRETHLWGDPEFRNQPVEIDWLEAYRRFLDNVNNWVTEFPIPTADRATFKTSLVHWFKDCERRAEDKKLSARVALQLLGTEYGRGFRDSIWVDYFWENVVRPVQAGMQYHPYQGVFTAGDDLAAPGVVITDGRFVNELKFIQERGGYIIRLFRKTQTEETETDKVGLANHASETEMLTIPLDQYDLVLEIDEGLDAIHSRLRSMMEGQEWQSKKEEEKTDVS